MRQQDLCFMHGVLARTDDGDFLAAVKEGIADGAVAHTLALEFCYPRYRQRAARSTGSENDGRCLPLVLTGSSLEAVERIVEGERQELLLDDLHAEASGTCRAAAQELLAGDRLSKAVVILDFLRLREAARLNALCHDRHREAAAPRIERC